MIRDENPTPDDISGDEDAAGPVSVLPAGTLDAAGTLEIGAGSFAVCSGALTMECGCVMDLSGPAFELGAGVPALAGALVESRL